MEPDRIPEYPSTRVALLGCVGPNRVDGRCEWSILLRDDAGDVLDFQRMAMGGTALESAHKMTAQAEKLLRSSGYEIKRSEVTLPAWTASWDIVGTPDVIDAEAVDE